MQKCEIMLNDLIGSKRTNTNIKATIAQPSHTGSFLNIYIFSRIGVITFGAICSCITRRLLYLFNLFNLGWM